MHIANEAKTFRAQSADQALLGTVVADGASDRTDARLESYRRNDATAPDGILFIGFADKAVAITKQMFEKIENPWFDEDKTPSRRNSRRSVTTNSR